MELPDGSDEFQPAKRWDDSSAIPVDVRATDEVTSLPLDTSGEATTEQVPQELTPGAPEALAPVDVSVAPLEDEYSPALVVTVEQGAATGPSDDAPAPTETAGPNDSGATQSVPDGQPSDAPSQPRAAQDTPIEEPTETASGVTPTTPTEGSSDAEGGAAVPDEGDGVRGVEVRVSYSDFRYAFGGDWGARLRVLAYPACFLTTPEESGCSEGVVVPSVNDPASETVTFTTTDLNTPVAPALPDGLGSGGSAGMRSNVASAAGGAGGIVYTLSAGVSGGAGDYGSSAIQPSATWQVGEGSGEFSYSYPIAMPPPAVAGISPSLGLNYSSGSVDGMTKAVNGQASMMGIGWSMEPGFISRQYRNCSDDGWSSKGDKCWMTDGTGRSIEHLSIVLNGRSSELILVPGTTSRFRLQDDPGWQVNRITNPDPNPDPDGPLNTDNNNEAFKVRTPDGTEYWFGWGHGSGSTWTVPVYGNDAGEPCHASSNAASWCMQGWRWNLDKVVDRNGNAIEYSYEKETNYYSRYATTTNHQAYDRGGYLSEIRYGESREGGTGGRHDYSAVSLATQPRCTLRLTNSSADCSASAGNGPRQKPELWPDTPADLICDSNDNCLNGSPSFFSTQRYDRITTKRWAGTTYIVDQYQLKFEMPTPGSDGGSGVRDLWLASIQRTGGVGSSVATPVALPLVQFGGVFKRNRVDPPAGAYSFNKMRLSAILTETGGRIDVKYGHVDGKECVPGTNMPAGYYLSKLECFPQKLNGSWEWWHKYVVTRVGLGDAAMKYELGQAANSGPNEGRLRVIDYEYLGDPAWRWRNNPVVVNNGETWDDWRGYASVVVHQRRIGPNQVVDGDIDVATRKVTSYRGLYSTRSNLADGRRYDYVTTTKHNGTQDPDYPWFAGRVAETLTYDTDGTVLSRHHTDYDYWSTAENPTPFDPDAVFAYASTDYDIPRWPGPERTVATTVDPGTTEVSHTGHLLGAVRSVTDDHATPSVPSDDTVACTSWSFNGGSALRVPILERSKVGDLSCGNDNGQLQRTVHYYDGSSAYGAPPSRGNETLTKNHVDSTTAIETRAEYESLYGRPTKVSRPYLTGSGDPVLWTTTAYNPGGDKDDLVTSVSTTTPASGAVPAMTTTTGVEVRRSLPESVTDAGGQTTTIRRDGLGRPKWVDLPGRPSAAGSNDHSISYEYLIPTSGGVANGPARITTKILRGDGSSTNLAADTSWAYYDGWGRHIESQQLAYAGTSRVVSATSYDELGLPLQSSAAFPVAGVTPELANPNFETVNHYTETTYDGAGRPRGIKDLSALDQNSYTSYSYVAKSGSTPASDLVQVYPSAGASSAKSSTRSEYNDHGQISKVVQYENGNTANPANDDYATYTYDPAGQLKTITTPLTGAVGDSITYTYAYDYLGRRTSSNDPDVGMTTYGYDASGNTVLVDNPTPDSIKTEYDVLDRPVARRRSSDNGLLASWTYDTLSNGKGRLTSSTSYTPLGDFSKYVDTYDVRGNPTKTSFKYPAVATGEGSSGRVTKSITTTYDQLNQPIATTYPAVPAADMAATTTTNVYGTSDMFAGTVADTGRYLAVADYDVINRPVALNSAGTWFEQGLNRYYAWGNDDRLAIRAAYSGSTIHALYEYTYDALGNPIKVKGQRPDTSATTAWWCYEYDGISRLTAAKTGTNDQCTTGTGAQVAPITGAKYDLTYAYAQTRMVSSTGKTDSPTPTTFQTNYAYAPTAKPPHAPSGLATTGSAPGLAPAGTLTYGPAGRVATWTQADGSAVAYTYDEQGNLKATTTTPATGTPTTSNYAYDTDGMRWIRQDGTAANGSTTVYLGPLEITKSVTGGATVTSARRTYTAPGGTPVASEETSNPGTPTFTWLLGDQNHSVSLGRTLTGNITNYAYYPFGDPAGATTAPGGKGYLNKTRDPVTSEVRLDHRNYDPSVNTLTTPDPLLDLSEPQNLNAYAYAGNNPITFGDPSGLCYTAASCENDLVHGIHNPAPPSVPLSVTSAAPAKPSSEHKSSKGGIGGFINRLLGRTPSQARNDAVAGLIQEGVDILDEEVHRRSYGRVPEGVLSDPVRRLFARADLRADEGWGIVGKILGPFVIPGAGLRAPATIARESAELALLGRGARAANRVTHAFPEGRLGHIFRDARGHLPDTPANRRLLQSIADDPATTLGTDRFGNGWSARLLDDGTQAWVTTRNGDIINGGLNEVPRPFNPLTGLSRPEPPRN